MAKESARKISCVNNEKQIGTITFVYQGDFEAYFPVSYGPSGISWDDLYSSYDGRNLTEAQQLAGGEWGALTTDLPGGKNHGELYRCPSDNDPATAGFIDMTYQPSYIWGDVGAGEYTPYLGVTGALGDGGNFVYTSRKSSAIKKNSGTIIFSEIATNTSNIVSRIGASWIWKCIYASEIYNDPIPHHKGGGRAYNFLMGDGHVEPMSKYETLKKSDGSTADPATDVTGTPWDSTR